MIKGTKEELDDIAGTYQCLEHPDKALTVAWHQTEGYVIRCGAGHYPEAVTRQPSLTQLYKQGVELPETIKSNVVKGMARRSGKQPVGSDEPFAALLPSSDLGSGNALLPASVQLLISYAAKYGLDAYRGHVMMMYGKPYIGIDGYLYHANKEGKPYQLRSRPLDQGERAALQLKEGDHAWKAEIIKPIGNEYFVGIGIVTLEEMTATSKKTPGQLAAPVVAKHPWLLAQKRAEWQALRRAFPIGETE